MLHSPEEILDCLNARWIALEQRNGFKGLTDLRGPERAELSQRLRSDYPFDKHAAADMLEILGRSGVSGLSGCCELLDEIQAISDPHQAPGPLFVKGGLSPSEIMRRYFHCLGFRTAGAQVFVYAPFGGGRWFSKTLLGTDRVNNPIVQPGSIVFNQLLSEGTRYELSCTIWGGEEVVTRISIKTVLYDDFLKLSDADFDGQAKLFRRFAGLMLEVPDLGTLLDRLPRADEHGVTIDHELCTLTHDRGATNYGGRQSDEHYLTLTLQVSGR